MIRVIAAVAQKGCTPDSDRKLKKFPINLIEGKVGCYAILHGDCGRCEKTALMDPQSWNMSLSLLRYLPPDDAEVL